MMHERISKHEERLPDAVELGRFQAWVRTGGLEAHESTLVQLSLDLVFTEDAPVNLIGDKAYDSACGPRTRRGR